MKVVNISKNTILGERIEIADTFVKRFLGLMPRKTLNEGEGLVINPCNSIHMFFMSFPIDVLFIDKNNKIVHIEANFKPWRISKFVKGGKYVIELPVGVVKNTLTEVGDIVSLNDEN